MGEQQIPLGSLPQGIQIKHPAPQLPPDLVAALRRARDDSGGRWAVAVFTADAAHDDISLLFSRGGSWNDRKAFLAAYQLFVAEFLRIDPGMLAAVQKPLPPEPGDEIGPLYLD